MKKLLYIILLNVTILFSASAKRIEGLITYHDKRVVTATLLIPFSFLSSTPNYTRLQDEIRYLVGKEKRKFQPNDIEEITFVHNGETIRLISVFDNLQLSNTWASESYKFLKLVVDGPVRVYDYYSTSYSPGMYSGGMMTGGGTYVTDRLVLQRNDGELMRPRALFFKKDMAEFFADCPELVERINAKVFRRADLEVLVKEYNTKCY